MNVGQLVKPRLETVVVSFDMPKDGTWIRAAASDPSPLRRRRQSTRLHGRLPLSHARHPHVFV